MKLDLIKKLTALANNNPNENEANLAARKVCLMLAECKFVLGVESPRSSHTGSGTWGDVNRTKEPDFKSTPPKNPFRSASNPVGSNPFWDMFNDAFRDGFKDSYSSYSTKGDPFYTKTPKKDPPQEPFQTKEDPFKPGYVPYGDVGFDIDSDYMDKIFGSKVGGGKTEKQRPKRSPVSKIRNIDESTNTVEVTCLMCKGWFQTSIYEVADVKGCYVCSKCRGK